MRRRRTSGSGVRSLHGRALSLLLGLVAAVTALALLTGRAPASCAPPASPAPAISAAPIVFVGTVTAADNGGRVATVQVSDVWKGASVGTVVRVVGTPDLGAAATSVDRTYARGEQYLFVPDGGSSTDFQDNQCTATQAYSASLAVLRPAAAPGTPAGTTYGGGFPVALMVVVVVLAAVMFAGITLLTRRRRGSVATHI
jgi:hypothetical protein